MKNSLLGKRGFTLIELLVGIAIIATLSAIILFNVVQYINKGKDASIKGNLVILVPAGEAYYGANNDSYTNFCASSVAVNALAQIPSSQNKKCNVDISTGNTWAVCAQEFTDNTKAYCVDSKGIKEEINNSACIPTLFVCP